MQRLALVLSAVACLLSAWAAWKVAELPATRDAAAASDALADAFARIAALEKRAESAVSPPQLVTASLPADGATVPGPAPAGSGSSPTLEQIQKRIDALEATARGALGLAEDAPLGRDAARNARSGPLALGDVRIPKVYGTVEDAQKELDLSSAQRADFDRAVADARRELDELKKLPDADGVTWEQVQKDAFKSEGGSFHFDFSKVEKFREKTIPGRSESYGAADRRIRDQAKTRMRDALTRDQREKFDKAMIDPLLGGPGGGFAIATSFEMTEESPGGR